MNASSDLALRSHAGVDNGKLRWQLKLFDPMCVRSGGSVVAAQSFAAAGGFHRNWKVQTEVAPRTGVLRTGGKKWRNREERKGRREKGGLATVVAGGRDGRTDGRLVWRSAGWTGFQRRREERKKVGRAWLLNARSLLAFINLPGDMVRDDFGAIFTKSGT
ncbi:uncharacterized protein DS421_9g262600 [Arachis hypogaea]|nr:uncharacterized protein DS421_9g262600 [Arachis hypogaea]